MAFEFVRSPTRRSDQPPAEAGSAAASPCVRFRQGAATLESLRWFASQTARRTIELKRHAVTLNEAKALLEELGRSQRHSNHTPRLNTVWGRSIVVIGFRCRLSWYKGGRDAGRDFYGTARSRRASVERYGSSKQHPLRRRQPPHPTQVQGKQGPRSRGRVREAVASCSLIARH